MRSKLEKSTGENTAILNRLNSRNHEYEQTVKANNEEKQTLLKIIRRLEEEKKALENVNISAKGSASEQAKMIAGLNQKV